jgi:hypothetical protein
MQTIIRHIAWFILDSRTETHKILEWPPSTHWGVDRGLHYRSTHMTQKLVLRVEVGKGRLCGLLSLGYSTGIYCFSTLKQQKTEEITPDQRVFQNNRHERYSLQTTAHTELLPPIQQEPRQASMRYVPPFAPLFPPCHKPLFNSRTRIIFIFSKLSCTTHPEFSHQARTQQTVAAAQYPSRQRNF